MSLSQTDVRNIFSAHVVRGQWISVSDLQALVDSKCTLDAEDKEPYTETRETQYPKWHHVIQSTLAHLKSKGDIQHNVSDSTYMF